MPDLDVAIRTLIEDAADPVPFDEVVSRTEPSRSTSHRRRAFLAASFVVFVAAAVALGTAVLHDDRPSVPTASHRDGARWFTVPSESMSPTFHQGDRVRVRPLRHGTAIRRGDLVVLHAPTTASAQPRRTRATETLRRIVGLPGETIEGRDGGIDVDGVRLDESNFLPSGNPTSKVFGPIVIPADQYFVLGDNRIFANDSTAYGAVRQRSLTGLVVTHHPAGDPATWSVRPGDAIGPSTRHFTAEVSRFACNGGVTGAVLAPTISYGRSAVRITFTVARRGAGFRTCQGNRAEPVAVELDEPLGDRRLVDQTCVTDPNARRTAPCLDGGVRAP